VAVGVDVVGVELGGGADRLGAEYVGLLLTGVV
jgi:hypothetical protein